MSEQEIYTKAMLHVREQVANLPGTVKNGVWYCPSVNRAL
jgi:hypothetical protein